MCPWAAAPIQAHPDPGRGGHGSLREPGERACPETGGAQPIRGGCLAAAPGLDGAARATQEPHTWGTPGEGGRALTSSPRVLTTCTLCRDLRKLGSPAPPAPHPGDVRLHVTNDYGTSRQHQGTNRTDQSGPRRHPGRPPGGPPTGPASPSPASLEMPPQHKSTPTVPRC